MRMCVDPQINSVTILQQVEKKQRITDRWVQSFLISSSLKSGHARDTVCVVSRVAGSCQLQ